MGYFNLYLNERIPNSKIVNVRSINAAQKTNTSTSTIIKSAARMPIPAYQGASNRLLALKTNVRAAEKKSLATTLVPTSDPRVPTTHMQVGQYYQTEKNSINRASRVASSAGSIAPAGKYFKHRVF